MRQGEIIMNREKAIAIVNLAISGWIAYIVAHFYAAGSVAEIYTYNEPVEVPHFLFTSIIWGIGALFVLLQFIRNSTAFFIASLITTWSAFPVGLMLAIWIAMLLN